MSFKQYEFYGSSDDVFIEKQNNTSQDDCGRGELMAYRIIDDNGCGVVVTGQYCPNCLTEGTWSIAVAKLDEDTLLSDDWMFELKPHSGYKNYLVVTAPSNTRLEIV